jgi:hypothetical protein
MEVKTFIESQINPLMLVCSHMGISNYVPIVPLAGLPLWKKTRSGVSIPNLLSIDIGLGYNINELDPESDEYTNNPVISLITPIPESFFTNDISLSITGDIASSIERQIVAFFDDNKVNLNMSDGSKISPIEQMRKKFWSYMLIHGASIHPQVSNNSTLGFEVRYVR